MSDSVAKIKSACFNVSQLENIPVGAIFRFSRVWCVKNNHHYFSWCLGELKKQYSEPISPHKEKYVAYILDSQRGFNEMVK